MIYKYYEFSYGIYYGSSKNTKEDFGTTGAYAYSREEAEDKAIKQLVKSYEQNGYEKVIVHSVLSSTPNYI